MGWNLIILMHWDKDGAAGRKSRVLLYW